jgi:single-stranded DNA-binding protein
MLYQDQNDVFLCGLIGEDFQFGRTQDAKEYATFSLCVNAYEKEDADSTERTRTQQYIRVFCYDKRQVEYLKRMDVHRGQRASVKARLSSFKNEYKGITYMSLNVICRRIWIIKT